MTAGLQSVQKFLFALMVMSLVLAGALNGRCAETYYYGNYAGTFTGGDDGVWVGVLSAHDLAHLFISYSTKYDYGDGGNISLTSETAPLGTFSGTSLKGNTVTVTVDSSDGSVTGSWSNPPLSGSLEGDIVTSSPFAGEYTGEIKGDVTGTFAGTIDSTGTVTLTATVDGNDMEILGACHPDGWLMGYGPDPDNNIIGMVGKFSGSDIAGDWESETGDIGTFSGTRTVTSSDDDSTSSSDDGGGGGGGGGCFMKSLITP